MLYITVRQGLPNTRQLDGKFYGKRRRHYKKSRFTVAHICNVIDAATHKELSHQSETSHFCPEYGTLRSECDIRSQCSSTQRSRSCRNGSARRRGISCSVTSSNNNSTVSGCESRTVEEGRITTWDGGQVTACERWITTISTSGPLAALTRLRAREAFLGAGV